VKFLADESVEKSVVDWLRNQDFDVMYIPEKIPSISDDEDVLRLANNEDRILITNDKDFGELVFHQARIALGILLIRANNEKSSNLLFLSAINYELIRAMSFGFPMNYEPFRILFRFCYQL
jgi:predicted nuclease of predicted toxin-antitoxin system